MLDETLGANKDEVLCNQVESLSESRILSHGNGYPGLRFAMRNLLSLLPIDKQILV